MLTADQRKELEALEAEMRAESKLIDDSLGSFIENHHYVDSSTTDDWADRIAAVLANGGEEG
jgi:hypothetical protein